MDESRNPLHLVRSVTRNQFERMAEHLIENKQPVPAAPMTLLRPPPTRLMVGG